MAFDYQGRRADSEPETASAETVVEVEAEAPSETVDPSTESATPAPEVSETPPPEKKEKKEPVRLITEGVTVQVLNGTSDTEAGAAMEEELTKLGFQVVAVEATSKPYKETTVYWSFPDARDAANALGDKKRWLADQKPDNLSDTVWLHVVVGDDFL